MDGPIFATDGIPNAALHDRWWRDLGISEHIANDHSSRQKILKNADSPGTRCERIAEKGSRRNEVCENGAGAEAEAVTIA